ncbi:hypothetical protein D3C87_1528320 [compost metagenome]
MQLIKIGVVFDVIIAITTAMMKVVPRVSAWVIVMTKVGATDSSSTRDPRHVIQDGIHINIHTDLLAAFHHVGEFCFSTTARMNLVTNYLIAFPPRIVLPDDMFMRR